MLKATKELEQGFGRIFMKNIKLIVTTFGIGLAFLGNAAHASSAEAGDCNGCNQPPVSAGTPNPFSLELARTVFQSGTEPSQNNLVGSWTLVGSAAVPGQTLGFVDAYDVKGLKNTDGSDEVSLLIQMETDFAGNPLTASDTVSLLNLGRKAANQGPNELTFNDREQKGLFCSVYL